MKFVHILCAVAAALCWGLNAPLVKLSIAWSPPLFFATMRSLLLGMLIIFFPRPRVSATVIGGFTIAHALKISFLYYSLEVGLGAGISTVLLQSQSLFTVFLAVLIFREYITLPSVVGLLVAFAGVCLIGYNQHAIGNLQGTIFVVIAAFFASISFLIIRKHKHVNYLSFVGWFNILSVVPFLVASYFVEGGEQILATLQATTGHSLLLLCLSALTVVIAYSFMMYLLGIYPTSQVAPYLLLIPIFGLSGSYACLSEWCDFQSTVGSCIVIAGLAYNQWGTRAKKTRGIH